MAGVTIKDLDRNHCIATHGCVLITLWGLQTTQEGVESVGRVSRELGSLCPDGLLCLTVVIEDAKPPTGEVRSSLARTLKSFGFVKRSALIFEGKGFVSAMVRGVATGLQMLQRFPYPHEVFDTPEVAIGWLLKNAPAGSSTPSGLDLLEALRSARQQFDQHRER